MAASAEGSFVPKIPGNEASELFIELLSHIVKDCVKAGATMIGHVKANIRSGEELMSVSSTTMDGNVRKRSVLNDDVSEFTIKLNVIVYGIDEIKITRILREHEIRLNTKFDVFSETSCNDPECEDPDCGDPAHRVIRLE